MSAKDQIIPAVSFTTAQTGASAKSDELGMRLCRRKPASAASNIC